LIDRYRNFSRSSDNILDYLRYCIFITSTMIVRSYRQISRRQVAHTGIFFNGHRQLSIDSQQIKDDIWKLMKSQASDMIKREPLLHNLIYESILKHQSFGDALIHRLATKLAGQIVTTPTWLSVLHESLKLSIETREDGKVLDIERLAMEDLIAIDERDPACKCVTQAFLYFKGFKALQAHRFAHILWLKKREDLAHLIQARVSEVFDIDIHPGATIGGGLMLDHGTGVVIGETAKIGVNCSLLHGVTLGGTGNQLGDRHPKLGDNVLIGCGATILGNISIGSNSRIGSGSMILKPLPAGSTAVGNPVRVLHRDNTISPSEPVELLQGLRSRADVEEHNQADTERFDQNGVKVWSHVWVPKSNIN
jgi:serine O-acetyltransferase